jgi:hypothetical protein
VAGQHSGWIMLASKFDGKGGSTLRCAVLQTIGAKVIPSSLQRNTHVTATLS